LEPGIGATLGAHGALVLSPGSTRRLADYPGSSTAESPAPQRLPNKDSRQRTAQAPPLPIAFLAEQEPPGHGARDRQTASVSPLPIEPARQPREPWSPIAWPALRSNPLHSGRRSPQRD